MRVYEGCMLACNGELHMLMGICGRKMRRCGSEVMHPRLSPARRCMDDRHCCLAVATPNSSLLTSVACCPVRG